MKNHNDRNKSTDTASDDEIEALNIRTAIEELSEQLNRISLRRRTLEREEAEIQTEIQRLEVEQQRQSETRFATSNVQEVHDVHGNILNEGDYVNFLTKGKFDTRGGTITKIQPGHRFLTAKDRKGRLINREPKNVLLVRKVNEQHDRRKRWV